MLKDNARSRIFIRLVIGGLRLITPLCFVYLVARIVSLTRLPPKIAAYLVPIDGFAIPEVLFYLFVYLPRRWYLNRPAPASNTLPSPEERKFVFEKTWDTTPDPRGYLSLWFKGVAVEDLSREDVKDWIHWRLWNNTDRQGSDEDELEDYAQHVEKILGLRFLPGWGRHTAMMVTVEPLRMAHRPIVWYQHILGAVDIEMFIRLWFKGYRYYAPRLKLIPRSLPFRPLALFGRHRTPVKHLSYFYRPHKSPDSLPVLFVHGIGVGLGFYTPFLTQFANEHPDLGIIALEILPISGRITHSPLRQHEMADEVGRILDTHGWDRVLLLTHSYGSVVAAQLLHSPETASMIGPLIFVDPVTFSFHPPEVAWNFLRRRPTTASEHQLQYFASLDPGVAQALTRSFVWTENSLWREDVEDRGDRCTVALAGRDIITDTNTLGAYLTREEREGVKWYEERREWPDEAWKQHAWTGKDALEVVWFEDLNHSEIFDGKEDRDRLFEVIDNYARL